MKILHEQRSMHMIQTNSSFINVFTRNAPEPVYSFRSGLTVYEERFLDGMLITGGWNTAGYPLNEEKRPPFVTRIHEPSVFHLSIDGVSVEYRLSVKDFTVTENENGTTETALTLASAIKPVEIVVHTKLDGTVMFSRWLEVRNLSDKAMAVSRLSVFSGVVEETDLRQYGNTMDPEEVYELGYFKNYGHGNEGDMTWRKLSFDKTSFSGRFGRYRYRHPLFFLKNKNTGMFIFGQLAHSGAYEFSFDYDTSRNADSTRLAIDMAIDGFLPLYLIGPGQTFVTPEVHIGAMIGTLDDAVNASYDHIRRSVLNRPEADGSECLVVSGVGAEHSMTTDLFRFMEEMAAEGAEVFIIDAGWFCPPGEEMAWWDYTGIWTPDPDRYPYGIGKLRDHAHKLGMKFGLWMEPERIGQKAGQYAKHPDWYTSDAHGRSSNGLIDFTVPEAAAWVESEIERLITEYELDLFRLDYNACTLTDYFMKNGTRQEFTVLKHYEAVYAMFARLKKKFPHVLFENCAGGGGRTDLGMLQSFNHTWVSDWQIAPRSVYITLGMTMALPPERVDRLVSGMGCHQLASLDFQMRNVMLGHITLNVFAPADAEWNDEQLAFLRHSIGIYKNFIRPFLPTSHMYHHNDSVPQAEKEGFLAFELVAADKSRAAMTIFALPGLHNPEITVYPRGLDIGRTYRVTFDNSGSSVLLTGAELKQNGIRTVLSPMTSELVLFENV